jgi:hypothetical protein
VTISWAARALLPGSPLPGGSHQAGACCSPLLHPAGWRCGARRPTSSGTRSPRARRGRGPASWGTGTSPAAPSSWRPLQPASSH